MRNWNYYYYYHYYYYFYYAFFVLICFVCFCPFFCPSVFFWFVLFCLEFIQCVCGLIWLRCGGNVAWYVLCTNVGLKWYVSDFYIKIGKQREKCVWGRPKLLLVKRTGWLLTFGRENLPLGHCNTTLKRSFGTHWSVIL